MKRLLILLLCTAALLAGCGTDQPKPENPVSFFYPRIEYTFGQADSVIAAESREGGNYKAEPEALLNIYLQGPVSSELRNPFPFGSGITELRQEEAVLQLVMNRKFSELSGIELTLACCCLTKTCLTVTECSTVQIIMEDLTSETQRIITMDSQSLLLIDNIITTTPTETQEGL